MKHKKKIVMVFFIGLVFSRLTHPVPPPIDLSHVKGTVDEQVNIDYPSYYDLREQNRTTPVKNRVHSIMYYTYAAYGSLESFLAPDRYRNFYEPDMYNYRQQWFNLAESRNGTFGMVTAYLAAWAGPVDHPDEGYTYWSVGRAGDLQKHVQRVVFLPGRSGPLDNNTIKWFITNYVAVYAQMLFYSMFFSEINNCYYQYGPWGGTNNWPNVSLAIVGWDDNFDRNRFRHPAPPGNGAFLAKHSRGPYWGEDGGYFYISYYDPELKVTASFNNAEEITNYGAIYQYDPLGATSAVGNGNDSTVYWGANVFIARDNSPLEAVSFYTNDSHVNYEIYIYRGITIGSPVSGALAAAKNGQFTYPGYYTVKLDYPVLLNQGEAFSVVIKFENSGYTKPVTIEAPIIDYSTSAAANRGESYISSDGRKWNDLSTSLPNSNVCIKAFTSFTQTDPVPIIRLQAQAVYQKMWLIGKTYGHITFNIENLPEVPVHRIVLFRKQSRGYYLPLEEILPNELENGSYTYIDKYLVLGDDYTYHAAVYDSSEKITGKSNEQTISPER